MRAAAPVPTVSCKLASDCVGDLVCIDPKRDSHVLEFQQKCKDDGCICVDDPGPTVIVDGPEERHKTVFGADGTPPQKHELEGVDLYDAEHHKVRKDWRLNRPPRQKKRKNMTDHDNEQPQQQAPRYRPDAHSSMPDYVELIPHDPGKTDPLHPVSTGTIKRAPVERRGDASGPHVFHQFEEWEECKLVDGRPAPMGKHHPLAYVHVPNIWVRACVPACLRACLDTAQYTTTHTQCSA